MIYRSFDDLFQAVLTAIQNASQGRQIAVGDPLFQRAAGFSSGVWGLYRQADYVRDQIWADTGSEDSIVHHAGLMGITRAPGEDAAQLLGRYLARIRSPASGGNRVDFEQWAMSVPTGAESISSITCYPSGYGPGTCVLVVRTPSGNPISSGLQSAIKAFVVEKGPVAPSEIYITPSAISPVVVTVAMVGGSASICEASIRSYFDTLIMGQAFSPQSIQALAFFAGATSVTVSSPAAVVDPGKFGFCTLSTLTVTAS
jgi:uncharacterized phage protein gp47/JayE